MDMMILEVDGSLDNPIAAAAVAIWAAVLSGVAVTAALRGCPLIVRLGALALFLAMSAGTRYAQHLIGNIMYAVADRRIVSVGFWGGPPTWIAPLVAGVAGATAWVVLRRRTFRRNAASRPPFELE